jgi:hypothetical protein
MQLFVPPRCSHKSWARVGRGFQLGDYLVALFLFVS